MTNVYIFYVILVLSLCFFIFTLKVSVETGVHFNGHLFFWLVTLVVIYLPNLRREDDFVSDQQLAVLLCNTLGGALALLLIPLSRFRKAPMPAAHIMTHELSSIGRRLVFIMAVAYALLMLSGVTVELQKAGGILASVSRDRLTVYLTSTINDSGAVLAYLKIPLLMAYLLQSALWMRHGRWISVFAFFLLFEMYVVVTSNTRLPVIFPIAAYSWAVLHFRRPALLYKKTYSLAAVGMALVALVFSAGNYFRNGQAEALLSGDVNLLDQFTASNSGELRYLDWLGDLVQSAGRESFPFDFGMAWFVRPLVTMVPRSLWDEKPITSTSNLLSEYVYGWSIGSNEPVTTFTLAGEGYWQFGYLGVIASPIIFILLTLVASRSLAKLPYHEVLLPYFMLSLVPFVRAEQPIVKVALVSMSSAALALIVSRHHGIKRVNIP